MTARDALFKYKNRDTSEKLFRADKTFTGAKSERTHTNETTRSRIFSLLREAVINNNIKSNFMTVPATVKELDKIECVMTTNEMYMLDHAVTKTQKTILSAFGITEGDVREEARKIANTLATKKGLPKNEEID